MKKLLIILLVLISVQGYSQQRTSYDVLQDINNRVGSNIKMLDNNMVDLINLYTKLKTKELKGKPLLDNIATNQVMPNSILQFCLTCRCPNDPYYDAQPCGLVIPHCGLCPACHAELLTYIQNCENSPCLQY
jgi:hypothetical protein